MSATSLVNLDREVQYRYSIPAPVDRTSARAWLDKHPCITCQNISEANEWPTQLANQSYVQLWYHPCIPAQEWMTIVRAVVYYVRATVQIFNYCTSRPDVCQCLVVQTPLVNMSIKTSRAHHWHKQIKATFICEVIHASRPRKMVGNWVYGRVLCLGCPRIKCRT